MRNVSNFQITTIPYRLRFFKINRGDSYRLIRLIIIIDVDIKLIEYIAMNYDDSQILEFRFSRAKHKNIK